MFSGIVEELGTVAKFAPKADGGARLTVGVTLLAERTKIGDSISINGVCLTVTAMDNIGFGFDVSAETLRVTNLGLLSSGDRVNLEPSLRVGDTLGGHFVSGHVDAVGTIVSKKPEGDCTVFRIQVGAGLTRLLIDRGSVAVDGISLTVTKIGPDYIEFVIIPHTAGLTTLGTKGAGDQVNLEADMIGKYVAKLVEQRPE